MSKAIKLLWAFVLMAVFTASEQTASAQEEEVVSSEPTTSEPTTYVDEARGWDQPTLTLPFDSNQKWVYRGGPHGDDGYRGIQSAIDIAPPSTDFTAPLFTEERCGVSTEFVLAAAPGLVTTSHLGEVTVDLDGDGNLNNSWSLLYYHMADQDRVPVGTVLQAGDKIGRLDCTYGITYETHLHFGRMYMGSPVAVDDPERPMVLSGWSFESSGASYIGTANHPKYGVVESFVDASVSNYDSTDPNLYRDVSSNVLTNDVSLKTLTEIFGLKAELAGKTWRFRVPLGLLRPDNVIKNPNQVGAFVGGRLASSFGPEKSKWLLPVATNMLSSHEEDHTGRNSVYAWDLTASQGAAIYPAAAGTVQYAGCNNSGKYGCWVKVKHDNGYTTLYAHFINERDPDSYFSSNSSGDPQGYVLVKAGDNVEQWTPLGRVGMTGLTGWSHVHFEVYDAGGARIRVDGIFDRSLLEYCLSCEPHLLEWEWDKPYTADGTLDTSTLNATALTTSLSALSASSDGNELVFELSFFEVMLIIGFIALLLLGLFRFGLVWSAVKLMGGPAVWFIRGLLRFRRSLNAFWWWRYIRTPVSIFLFAAIPGFSCAILVWLLQTGFASAAFAREITYEMLSRVPFSTNFNMARLSATSFDASNTTPIAWLPESVSYWWPEITSAAQAHDVDPRLFAIVITAESCGDPGAESPGVGAQGLSQVMPTTGRGIADERGIDGYTVEKLLDPEYNLDFGAYYLGQQYRAFGNVLDAAGAYNGGPGNMANYLEEGIPLPEETVSYRKWVGGMWNEKDLSTSPTLNAWLAAGGQSMCDNARSVLASYPKR